MQNTSLAILLSFFRRSAGVIALILLLALATAHLAQAASVPGTMNEKTKVDQNGAFNFSIPIEVPPGISGRQPTLTLSYNSQRQNGIAGVGWALSGLPSVERTKRIRAIDDINGTIAYDANDRFSYQGQRLIVTTGTYSAPESIYRTEVESWQQATAHGTAGVGPQYFTVQAKSGQIYEQGNTPDSRILAAGRPDVRSWNVNKVTDLNGNSMLVSYTDDPLGTGVPDHHGYPLQIAYTQNASQQVNRYVRFTYESRPDVQRTFIGGSEVATSVRLSHIQTFVGTAMVSDYRLQYDASNATGRSRLLSVTRYASNAADAVALAPSTFTYADGALAFSGKQNWLSGSFSKKQGWDGELNPFTLADVNGDGFLDIVGFKNGVQVALGGSAGFQAASRWINDFSGDQGWNSSTRRLMADVNGDGLADIVGISNQGVNVAISSGKGFTRLAGTFSYFSSSQGWTSTMPVMLIDVNGDKVMDIVGIKNGTAWVALGKGDGTFNVPAVWLQNFGQPGANYLAADLNGDGNADLMVVANNQAIQVALSTGSAFETSNWRNQGYRGLCGAEPVTAQTPLMVSDTNGDGLADVVAFCASAVYVTLSNGQGFEPSEKWNTTFAGPDWSAGNLRMLTDLNGDGLADLVAVTSQGVIAAVSNGHAFVDGKWNNSSLPWGLNGAGAASVTTRLLGDANGDGLMDMIGIGDTNVYVGLSAGAIPDLMTGAVRAAGATYALTYAPLSDPAVYTETQLSALAQFQNFPPFASFSAVPEFRSASRLGGFYHVVKIIALSDNPAVGDTAFNYRHQLQYRNGKIDLNGRGWLGFASVTTNSLNGSKQSVNSYRQDFPMIGQLGASTTYDRLQSPNCSGSPVPYEGQALTYAKTQTTVSTSAQATPIYFVGLTARATLHYQSCAVANTTGTAYTYDSYGNQTLITQQNLLGPDGQPIDPSRNVYTRNQYLNDGQQWRLGYLQFSKVSSSSNASNVGVFTPGVDFSLSSLSYDARMNVLSRGNWDDGNRLFLSTNYTYDGFGNRTTTTVPTGAHYTSTYDSSYQTYPVIRTVAPSAGKTLTWRYGYDPRFGSMSVSVNPNQVSKARCYDSFGRVAATQGPYPDNRSKGSFDLSCVNPMLTGTVAPPNLLTIEQRSFIVDQGLPGITTSLLSAWPQGAERTSFQVTQYLDGLWRKSKLVLTNPNEAQLIANRTAYSEQNRIARSATPYFAGGVARFILNKYDVQGRPIETSTPFGAGDTSVALKTYTATATGTQMSITSAAAGTEANTVTMNFGYAAGKPRLLTMMAQGISTGTQYTYDLLGRRTLIKAPLSQDGSRPSYSYTYDSLNRTLTKSEPARGSISYQYDAYGKLAQQNQGGGSFRYSYDLLGRLTGSVDTDGRATAYTYDDASVAFGLYRTTTAQVTVKNLPQSSYRYAYDAYGRTAQVTLGLADTGGIYTTQSMADPQRRLILVTNPDGSKVQRNYSGTRLNSVALVGGASASYANYSAGGTARTVRFGNGTVANYVLNVDESPQQLTISGAAGDLLLARQFSWNRLGQLVSVADPKSSAVLQQYSYSGLRLSKASYTPSGSTWSFAYDDTGNMTQYNGDNYTYSGIEATSASGANGFKAVYGSMGNMQSLAPAGQAAQTYTYNLRNEMTQASQGQNTTSYLYDGAGRRIAANSTDGRRTVYVSPWYMDSVTNGTHDPIHVLLANHVPFAQWGGIAGDTSQFYLHTDHQRSVVLTSGRAGTALSNFSYSPLGELINPAATLPRFLYTAKELDPQGGYYWLGSRAYQPSYGRFLKADDQFGGPLNRPDALNNYAYVLNNPSSYLDPSGHTPLGIAGGVCWVVASALGITAAAGSDPDVSKPVGIAGGATGVVCGVLNVIDSRAGAAPVVQVGGGGGGANGGGGGGGADGGGGGGGADGGGGGGDGGGGGADGGGGGGGGADGGDPLAAPQIAGQDGAEAGLGGADNGAGVVNGANVAAPDAGAGLNDGAAFADAGGQLPFAEPLGAGSDALGSSSISNVASVDVLSSAGASSSVTSAAVPDVFVASVAAQSAESAVATTATASSSVAASSAVAGSVTTAAAAPEGAAVAGEVAVEIVIAIIAL